MPEITRKGLFAEGNTRWRPGSAADEWAVWIAGMDDVLPMPDLTTALMEAAERNAVACDIYTGHEFEPVMHAVVLHHGYAWRRDETATEGESR